MMWGWWRSPAVMVVACVCAAVPLFAGPEGSGAASGPRRAVIPGVFREVTGTRFEPPVGVVYLNFHSRMEYLMQEAQVSLRGGITIDAMVPVDVSAAGNRRSVDARVSDLVEEVVRSPCFAAAKLDSVGTVATDGGSIKASEIEIRISPIGANWSGTLYCPSLGNRPIPQRKFHDFWFAFHQDELKATSGASTSYVIEGWTPRTTDDEDCLIAQKTYQRTLEGGAATERTVLFLQKTDDPSCNLLAPLSLPQ